MKVLKDITSLYEKLQTELGDDLVVSLALDEGKYYLAISAHKSKTQQYIHGRNIQSCLISRDDLEKDIDVLVKQIVTLYRNQLVDKDEVI